ncbi:MAG: peptidase, partial [Frankiales bacterium]|nr:peptidase [Frankiales bacterium]
RAAEAAQAAAERAAAVTGYSSGIPGVPVSYTPGAVTSGGGGGCAPAAPHGYANGFLPDDVLCPLPGRPGARLRTDAAQSFVAMDAARTAAGLPRLCVTDSYRDYAGQLSVFARKPGLAAVPGRSQHGWGLAVDFCGGVERFDGEAHLWMLANAPRFGWIHPAWAEPGGSKPEAWHWEFQGGRPGDGTAGATPGN